MVANSAVESNTIIRRKKHLRNGFCLISVPKKLTSTILTPFLTKKNLRRFVTVTKNEKLFSHLFHMNNCPTKNKDLGKFDFLP